MKSTWENKKEKMSLNYWQRSIWDAKGEPRKHLWTVDDRREGRRSLKTYENTLNVNLPVKNYKCAKQYKLYKQCMCCKCYLAHE